VKTVKSEGNNTVITTEPATVEEVVQNADVHEHLDLNGLITEIYDDEGNPVSFSSVQTKSLSSGIKIDVDKTVKFNNNFSAGLKGSVEIKVTSDFDMSIRDWKLDHLQFTTQPEFKAKLSLIGLEGTIKSDSIYVNIAKFKTTPITIWIGIVPLVFTPEISIDAMVGAKGTVKLEASLVDMDYKYTYGMKYENGQFIKISQNDSEPIKILENVELLLSGEIKVEPQLSFKLKIYDQEAYLGVYGGFYTKLSVDDIKVGIKSIVYGLDEFNPKMKLSCGISLGPEAKLKVFSEEIAEWKPKFDVITWYIWERNVFPVFNDITFDNQTENSITAKSVIKVFDFIFPVTQHGFCWGEEPFPTVTDNVKNELGPPEPISTSIVGALMHVDITNLKAGSDYYIRPYFTNMFGTFYGKTENFKGEVLINNPAGSTPNDGSGYPSGGQENGGGDSF
jgi:hypothetical protein